MSYLHGRLSLSTEGAEQARLILPAVGFVPLGPPCSVSSSHVMIFGHMILTGIIMRRIWVHAEYLLFFSGIFIHGQCMRRYFAVYQLSLFEHVPIL